jgi:bacterioferritin
MKGKPNVVAKLNELLAGELSSMDTYLLQGRTLGDWGYKKLSERLVHESEDERKHADALIQRILFLDGDPNVMGRIPMVAGKTPKEMLENDLRYELDVAKALNEAMRLCVNEGDNASRALLEGLLTETESDHIFWLEQQLGLIAAVGLEQYLAEQL